MASTAPQKLSVEQAFAVAYEYQKAGALGDARPIYERILSALPHHAQSLTMLSSIAYQEGRDLQAETYLDRAVGLYRAALERDSSESSARAHLVNLLLARGRCAEAEAFAADLSLPIVPIRAGPEAFERRRAAAQRHNLPPMLINTIPKSASESIWNKLAEGLEMAQAHVSIGLFPDCTLVPSRAHLLAQGGLIAKEHLPASRHNLKVLSDHGIGRIVFHVRDPRQATLSWAHFVRDDVSQRLIAPLWRKVVPPAPVVRGELNEVVDWSIDSYMPFLVEFMSAWIAADRDSEVPIEVRFLTFELFRTEPARYFDRVLEFYGVPGDRFAADADAEVVHLRKGQTDEWRGVFSETQRRRAWNLIPDDMAEAFGWAP